MGKIVETRNRVLRGLAGKLNDFYLAGGTALSLFYFHHRESYDLDFFTKDFSRKRIQAVMSALAQSQGRGVALSAEHDAPGFVKIAVYAFRIDDTTTLKIDFVEDAYPLIEPLKIIDGIPMLSLPDIYFRKIITACGSVSSIDDTGKRSFTGGRQEAKDFFDLYALSVTFMPLSVFVQKYCRQPQKESVIVWFRTYDRLMIKAGLPEIITDKKVDFREMERHFKNEIEKIIAAQI